MSGRRRVVWKKLNTAPTWHFEWSADTPSLALLLIASAMQENFSACPNVTRPFGTHDRIELNKENGRFTGTSSRMQHSKKQCNVCRLNTPKSISQLIMLSFLSFFRLVFWHDLLAS